MTRHLIAGLATAAAGVLSAGLGALALALAEGVTRVGPTSYRTEFVEWSVWYAAAVAAVPVAVASWCSWRWVLPAVGVASLPHWWVARTIVQRYLESGWGDGLEILAYLRSIGFTLLFVLVGLVAATSGFLTRRAWPTRSPVTPA